MTDPKYTATILLSDDGMDDVHVKCEFSGDGATDDSAAHRTAVVMMRNAISDLRHDELMEALREIAEHGNAWTHEGLVMIARDALAKVSEQSA